MTTINIYGRKCKVKSLTGFCFLTIKKKKNQQNETKPSLPLHEIHFDYYP